MVFKIIWSEESYKTFLENINYLRLNWSDKEIKKFTAELNKTIFKNREISLFLSPSVKHSDIRKAKINKHITLYYCYKEEINQLSLITFWNNKQNPDKLKY